jgi:DNA N-6-adenine-methyltransferase (Dam)
MTPYHMDDGKGTIAMGFFKETGYLLNANFASGDEYSTPTSTFQFFNRWMIDNGHRSFNLDPFSTKQNHKTPQFLTKRDNGYIADWEDRRAFVNPPFSARGVPRATTKIVDACRKGATAGALLPGWG